MILIKPDDISDDVSVVFLYAFSGANMVVCFDVDLIYCLKLNLGICWSM